MKAKDRNTIFVCQITENVLKIAKCLYYGSAKSRALALEALPVTQGADDTHITGQLASAFGKLGYASGPVFICVPRNQVTCRFVKIPAQIPEEIERIASLQAARYLPYPSNELITGFQIISTDTQGYTYINLIIAHKDAIERYIRIFKGFTEAKISILLSSYGLCTLYNRLRHGASGTAMVIDIDSGQAELAIISGEKLLFSRAFNFSASDARVGNVLIDQIYKSRDAYLKEVSRPAPDKIVIITSGDKARALEEAMKKLSDLPVEILSIGRQDTIVSKELTDTAANLEYSFAGLIGLGAGRLEETLNLLPADMKNKNRKLTQRKKLTRLIAYISGIGVLWALSLLKDLDNKERYLAGLRLKFNEIAVEAKPLEDMEKRLLLLENRSRKKTTVLELLQGVFQLLPETVSLVSFTYEENSRIILHGQAHALDPVLVFVSEMGKSQAFKDFTIKVRYATAKKTHTGEIVDFEIVCMKK